MSSKLPASLVKDFAKMANKKTVVTPQYVKGTAKVSGTKKYVQLDGSSQLTPIAETVDVQDGDRVLVSIENHQATILGNFTFPPSARKEQEAIDKAEEAGTNSNLALENATEAKSQAATAMENASTASSQAAEAIEKANDAIQDAATASGLAQTAQTAADAADQKADQAISKAQESFEASSNAQNEVTALQGVVEGVQDDITEAVNELNTQAGEIEGIKTNYSTKVEVNGVKAELETEISQSISELSTSISQTYTAKTDVVEIQGQLQTQITQNAEGISSQATKIEELEGDTQAAQQAVNEAKEAATQAQNAADQAAQEAETAQANADAANEAAKDAQSKADQANVLAIEAKADARVADEALQAARTALDEAKANYESVVNNPESTAEQIAQAQAAVDQAAENVNQALADAATAAYAAEQAQTKADQAADEAATAKANAETAQTTAENAQSIANTAKEEALQAQEDVAALTKRVTTAETNISQNAEQIALTATKTEEIGDLLQNDYYTKEETQSQIDIAADEIELSVTQTIDTKVQEEVSKIEVGARNLLLNSSFNSDFDNWALDPPLPGSDDDQPEEPETQEETEPVIEIFTDDTGLSSGHISTTTSQSIYQSVEQRLSIEDTRKIYAFSGDIKLENYTASDDTVLQLFLEGTKNASSGTGTEAITITTLSGSNALTQYADQGWVEAEWLVQLSDIPDDSQEGNYLNAGIKALNFTGDLYFKNLKLERGNKVTDWSPAPEDSESYVHDAIQTNNTTVQEQYKAAINAAADEINLIVQNLQTTINDQNESITNIDSTQVEINNDFVQFVSETTQQLKDLATGNVTATQIQEWARFDGATLELGASDSPFKTKLSNEELSFWQGDKKVAWIHNNELNILTAVITKSIGCGNFTWIDEGDLGLSLI